MNELNLLAISLTSRCNLACDHCYMDASSLKEGAQYELTTTEVQSILDQLHAANPKAMVVLTGGEPLLRDDLEEIIQHGSRLGLFTVVGTNGIQLTSDRVRRLKSSGLVGVGISLDSTNAQRHDRFRGKKGSWARTVKGLENCRTEGLSFQVHFTVTPENHDEIGEIITLSEALGARVVNIFFLVCTGRGRWASDLTPEQYDAALKEIVAEQARHPGLIIRPRCAPHFKRIALQMNPDATINRISGRDGDGCLAGIHYCRITPQGDVTACPYIEIPVGNIREKPLASIWSDAEQFKTLRDAELGGKCGQCEYRVLCGGCRARPVAEGEGIMASDRWCAWLPQGKPVITPAPEEQIHWDGDALERLDRIPGFIRDMVKKRAESLARDNDEDTVTVRHLDELIARRFGTGTKQARPPGIKMHPID